MSSGVDVEVTVRINGKTIRISDEANDLSYSDNPKEVTRALLRSLVDEVERLL